jgi:hypothetical protein
VHCADGELSHLIFHSGLVSVKHQGLLSGSSGDYLLSHSSFVHTFWAKVETSWVAASWASSAFAVFYEYVA